jgi:hypothetical protein
MPRWERMGVAPVRWAMAEAFMRVLRGGALYEGRRTLAKVR